MKIIFKILFRVLRTALVLWVIGYALATLLASLYLFGALRTFSPARNPAHYGVAYEDVRVQSRDANIELASWWLPNANASQAVVLVHGKDASRTQEFQNGFVEFAAALHRRGFNVLMIDLRGHGASTAVPVSFGIREKYDVLGAVDWLKAHGFAANQIGVLGVSMGAASSIGAMAQPDSFGALVSDCGFADFLPLVRQRWQGITGFAQPLLAPALWLRNHASGFALDTSRPMDDMRELRTKPVLIIHGTNDNLVPIQQAQLLRTANPNAQYWQVEGATHGGSYRQNPKLYIDNVVQFFKANLK